MKFSSADRPCLVEGAVVAPVADGEVVVATADSTKALVLNETGAIVVSLLTGGVSVGEIATLFSETLGLDAAAAERDVCQLLGSLADEGLLAAPGTSEEAGAGEG